MSLTYSVLKYVLKYSVFLLFLELTIIEKLLKLFDYLFKPGIT